MDKYTKRAKAEKAKQDEEAINRTLFWIVGGVALEFVLMLLNRFYHHYSSQEIWIMEWLHNSLPIIGAMSLVVAVAAAVWWIKHRDQKKAAFVGALALFMGGLALGCFAARFFGAHGLQLIYLAVPVAVILALVFFLYPKEFFVVCLTGVCALFGIWITDKGLGGAFAAMSRVAVVLAALVALVCAVVCKKAQSGKGTVEVKGKKVTLFPENANYALLYASAVISAGVLALAAFGLASGILYGAMVAWLLIMAVYYTVKMM